MTKHAGSLEALRVTRPEAVGLERTKIFGRRGKPSTKFAKKNRLAKKWHEILPLEERPV